MIIRYKLFENKNIDFYDDFFKKEIKDIDYYLNIIDELNINKYYIKQLFHWACREKLNEFVYKLSQKLNFNDLKGLIRSLIYLDFNYFKKIIIENNLLNYYLRDKDIIEHIISKGDVKKLKFLEENGLQLNQKILELSCFHNKLNIFKYLISKGLDPNKKTKNNFSYKDEGCLDISTKYNSNFIFIDYLVNDLNLPVTYRHMYNVLNNNDFKSLEILIKSKNLINDYSYSRYANHYIDKYEIKLNVVINSIVLKENLSLNIINKYVKILIKDKIDFAYEIIQTFNRNKIMNSKYLDICYYIIDKYSNKYENEYTTKFITTGYKDFWLNKMKENSSIIKKLKYVSFIRDYDYQKLILDIDEKNINIIINYIHPDIKKEYYYIPEIINLVGKDYNL